MASPYPKSKTTILLGMVLVIGLVASCGGETGAAPQPGAHFTATLAISPEAAGQAVLTFDVASSGDRIEQVTLTITNLSCAEVSAERSHYLHRVNVPVTSGRFTIEDPGIGVVTGRFEAPDQAAGEATIRYDADEGGGLSNFVIHDRTALCDLGTMSWVAESG